jgi:hypothetical protein
MIVALFGDVHGKRGSSGGNGQREDPYR